MSIVRSELPGRATIREEPINWQEVKKVLIENEGMWVLAAKNVARSTATQLNAGRNRNFRGPDLDCFEFAVRKPEDPAEAESYGANRTDLWGRYTAPGARRLAE